MQITTEYVQVLVVCLLYLSKLFFSIALFSYPSY